MIALLLIKPGPLLDGLDALLVSISEVQLVAHPNNAETALDFCKHNKTELVVIELRPDHRDLLNVVPEMKALCPQGNVVAIIHEEDDRRSAERAEADLVLSIGTRASVLKASIQELARTSV